jgi:sirohydrochlorin ferrochelatase
VTGRPDLAPPLPVVLAAHGTQDPGGPETVDAVARLLERQLGDRPVTVGYLDVIRPTVGDALARVDGPALVVPLLLAPGYHVDVDLPAVAAAHPHLVVRTASVGPDPRLLDAVLDRLREAGWRPGDAVVLGAAGSSSPASAAATRQAVAELAARTGSPVVAAYASASSPTPAEAVRALRAAGHRRVALATYLLAPGLFAQRMREAGADVVSDPIGTAPALLEVVHARIRTATAAAAVLTTR